MLTANSRYTRTDFSLDTRIRKRYIPLLNQQRRLRHLTSVAARNITDKSETVPKSAFFTLHQTPTSPAFYTSEMDLECLNPTWRSFEPSGFADEVNTATCYVVCRVWHVLESQDEPCCRVDWVVHFSGLVYLGEQIPKEGKKFKPNTLIFGTSEGYYGSPDCSLGSTREYSVKETVQVDSSNVRVSYSVITVNRIQTVQRAIKQTQASAKRTRTGIQKRLLGSSACQETLALKERLNLQSSILRQELEERKSALALALHRKEKLLQELAESRKEGSSQQEELQKKRELLQENRRFYCETRETYLKTSAQLALRRKQHISDLSCIYPIIKLGDKMSYNICGAHLPQSEDLAGQDETMISVALGYVTHLLLMISYFLNLPLRYPLRHFGSRSSVWDLVIEKVAEKEKEFPLFPRGKDRMYFSYAVYLLNKNIAQLRHLYGMTTHDLRMTLYNLYSFIDTKFNVRSDPYSSLQLSPTTFVGSKSELERNAMQVQIQTDPSQAINGTLELKHHQDMVADLTREIHSMTPRIPTTVGGGVQAAVPDRLSASHQLSCSLDQGLDEFCKLQRKLCLEESKPKAISQSSAHQPQQHSSFPNLTAATDNIRPPSPLQYSPMVDALRESLKMCSVNSTQNSDDDFLDHSTVKSDVSLVTKSPARELTDSL